MGSTTLLQAYKRAKFLRRVMQIAFLGIFLATVFWAVPWLPYGLSSEDYNGRLSLLVLLGLGAIVSSFGAFYLRDVSHRFEQTLMTWSTVHEGLGDLRRREYFFERVVIECQRCESVGGKFAVFALRFEVPAENDAELMANALEALEPLVRENDRLAALSSREIGVLASRVDNNSATVMSERLRTTIADAIANGDNSLVSAGWSVYGSDAGDAGALVGIARARLQGKDSVYKAHTQEGPPEDTGATADSADEARVEPDDDAGGRATA
jgi:GGDEF domain-containing protein